MPRTPMPALLLAAVLLLAAPALAAEAVQPTADGSRGPSGSQDAAETAAGTLDLALGDGPVFVVPIEGMIDAALANYVDRALADAKAAGASAVVFHVNTFGGLVDAADQIRTALLQAEVPTVAFVDPNAASAGALISLAADRIVMAPGASIGAATAVDGTGTYASEKVQSYMRGLMRSTAEATGRDPELAEAMVDERLVVEGVVEEGELLTLSANEAERLGLADAVLATEDAVLVAVGTGDREVVRHRATGAERALRFLGSPVLASLLMLVMLGGLYTEVRTPGVGFPGAAALIAAALFFAPHYLLGLAASWEIALFVLGVLLLVAEVFVLPGFGVAGASGLLLIVFSLGTALIGNVAFDFPTGGAVTQAILTLAATMVLLVVLGASLSRYLPRSQAFSHLVLAPELAAAAGYTSADTDDTLVGQRGVAVTTLRPSGVAEFEGRRVDVVTQGTFIAPGEPVEVVSVRGARVEVRPVRAANAAPA